MGSSEDVAVILAGPDQDPACLLYTVSGERVDDVRVTMAFTGPDGSGEAVPVPGWENRPLEPVRFAPAPDGSPVLVPAPDRTGRLVLSMSPALELLPGSAWSWEELGAPVRDAAGDGRDPFGFGHLFTQRMRVDLQVRHAGVPVGGATTTLLVCDLRRCGSLYGRLLTRLIAADAARQAEAAGRREIDVAYHPWYPVLRIGSDKASLYTRALVEDIARAAQHLADPGWLVRVGLYLEFLTFLGICEAVRDDVGDLLSPAERRAFETAPAFAELRARIDPDAWRAVWTRREMAFPRWGAPRTGPVSALNLLAKKRATLAFLHVHHQDLKHAIELAGVNHHNAQETWQRVFRDAERAVLRNIPAAFPELRFVPERMRDLVLWHRGVLNDQDGLFPSACNQYRASMNAVADWAKARRMMDHTGPECVPRQVSLLEAHMHQPARVALLQRHDGYGPALAVGAALPKRYRRPSAELPALLAESPLFAGLSPAGRDALADTARPLTLGPTERLVIEGHESSRSLFLIAKGRLEVLTRDDRGRDLVIDTMGKGAVVGEMSLLTDDAYSATVRAIDTAVVYEIGALQHDPVLSEHPDVVAGLQAIMNERLEHRSRRAEVAAGRRRYSVGRRLRARLAAR